MGEGISMSLDLLIQLKSLWQRQRKLIDSRFSRTLSFGDYVVDRWEKAEALDFGAGSSIYDSAIVFGDVSVGSNTWIGAFVILDGEGGLEIGNHCSISSGVQIYSHDSVDWAISGGSMPYTYGPTRIGDNCYIGPNVVIAKGVSIGDGCIIGANSLVLESIPGNSKAYGTPCRVVGEAGRTQKTAPDKS